MASPAKGFDPDAYLAEVEKPAFDPDEFLAEPQEEPGLMQKGLSFIAGLQDNPITRAIQPSVDEAKAKGKGLITGAMEKVGMEPEKASMRADRSMELGEAGMGAVGSLSPLKGAQAVSKAPGLLQKGASKLDDVANEYAFKSLRGYKKDITKAFKKGEVNQVGKELFDQGILKNSPKSVESLAEQTGSKLKEVGEQYGKVLDDISEKAGAVIDPTEAAINVMNKIDDHVKDMPELLSQETTRKSLYKNLENFVRGNKPLTIKDAQKVKQSLNQASKWDTNFLNGVPDDVKLARTLYHEMNSMIDTAADKFASQSGSGGEVVSGLRKQLYNLNVANKMAEGRSLGDLSNRFMSPTDYLSGAAGLVTGNPLTAAAMAAANKGVREYGSSAAAIAAKKAAQGLKGASGMLDKGLLRSIPAGAGLSAATQRKEK